MVNSAPWSHSGAQTAFILFRHQHLGCFSRHPTNGKEKSTGEACLLCKKLEPKMEYIPCAHKTWPITNHMATPQCTRDVKRSPLALQPLPVKNLDYGRGSRFGRQICTGCNIFFHIGIQKSNIIYWFASLFLHWLETVLLSYAHVYITPPVYGALFPDP